MKNRFLTILWRTFLAVLTILFLLIVEIFGAVSVISLGPSETAKSMFVNTVMSTSAAKFLAHIYFSDEEIAKLTSAGEEEVVEAAYNRFEGITANVQRIMNMLYLLTPKGETCGMEMIDRAIDTYLQLSSEYYAELLRQMPEKQRNVFLAIAAEKHVRNISGGKFVRKYHLPSTSSVVSAVKGLLEKDFITQTDNEYYVYDRFFQLWIEKTIIS